MQKHVHMKLTWKTLLPAAIAGAMLVTPLLGLEGPAEAKPNHGRALGHSKQSNWRRSERRGDRNDNGVRRRTRTRNGWDRRNRNDHWERNDNRRYRTRYRTRYNSNGTSYRQWYKQPY